MARSQRNGQDTQGGAARGPKDPTAPKGRPTPGRRQRRAEARARARRNRIRRRFWWTFWSLVVLGVLVALVVSGVGAGPRSLAMPVGMVWSG